MKKIRKIGAFIVAGVMMVTSLTGCGSSKSSAKGSSDSLTIEDGKLLVGLEIGYPPMEYFDEDGATAIGFDVELSKALSEEMGLEVEFVDTAWDGIFAGLDADKYDVVISTVSYTEDRNTNYKLSKPYIANAPVLIVPSDSDIASVEDLAGKTVAVQMETTADYIIQNYISGGLDIDLRQYEKVINAFDELKAGRTDAVCTDSVVAAYYLGDEATNYKTVWQSPDAEPIVMCLKKDNDALCEKLEKALDALKENGKLDEIALKYFGTTDVIPSN